MSVKATKEMDLHYDFAPLDQQLGDLNARLDGHGLRLRGAQALPATLAGTASEAAARSIPEYLPPAETASRRVATRAAAAHRALFNRRRRLGMMRLSLRCAICWKIAKRWWGQLRSGVVRTFRSVVRLFRASMSAVYSASAAGCVRLRSVTERKYLAFVSRFRIWKGGPGGDR